MVKNIVGKESVTLKSGGDIEGVKVLGARMDGGVERFVVARTAETFLVADISKSLVSEVVWCGVVWCGVVWCGVVLCGVVWCLRWCGVVWCGVVWCGVVWCGVVSEVVLCGVV